MTQTKPKIDPSLNYSQSSVMRILQVSRTMLYTAEKNGELIAVRHPNRKVTYSGANVLNLWETKRH